MDKFFHSVYLESDRCLGCTNCMKRCPTEAIRVREGKARIIAERCIDCGQCIQLCPHHAKKARVNTLQEVFSAQGKQYYVAIPAPSLYGQFNNLDSIDLALTALLRLGFDDVFEVAQAAELVSENTRELMRSDSLPKPLISSACPAVVRLIRVRFPDLCDHVLPEKTPMEVAARLARQRAVRKTGLPPEAISVTFITPCPAKMTDVAVPIGTQKSQVDFVVAISEVFPLLAEAMKKIDQPEALSQSGLIGVGWAGCGGESAALLNEKYLAADGIENVIRVLEELEDDRIGELDFIELNACSGGCVGGVLTVENAYVARARLQRLRKYLPVSCNHLDGENSRELSWSSTLEYAPVMKLSDDLEEALRMMNEIRTIEKRLPGLDCGSCGAPSCRALAEDIVRGLAREDDCIFILREQLQQVADRLSSIQRYVPPRESERENEP